MKFFSSNPGDEPGDYLEFERSVYLYSFYCANGNFLLGVRQPNHNFLLGVLQAKCYFLPCLLEGRACRLPTVMDGVPATTLFVTTMLLLLLLLLQLLLLLEQRPAWAHHWPCPLSSISHTWTCCLCHLPCNCSCLLELCTCTSPTPPLLEKILTGKKKSSSLKKTSNKLLLLLLLLHLQLKKLQCVCVRVHLGWRLRLLPLQWEKSLPGKSLLISYPKSRKKELEGDFIFPSLTWRWEEATSSLTPLIWRHSSPQICFVLHKNSTQWRKTNQTLRDWCRTATAASIPSHRKPPKKEKDRNRNVTTSESALGFYNLSLSL